MSGFLINTLVWTGVLIGFVLLVRRPTARWLGAPAAYALWVLPIARLLMPPIVLPAWMAPAPDAAMVVDETAAAAMIALDHAAMAQEPAGILAMTSVDWTALLLTVWLAGAGVFLVRRYALYFKMRRELLAESRPMGEAGKVRLVETPVADGPVAFGVVDKVIALPAGFMAAQDRAARDLALAHELAHHRGHDLLVNMLVQPLFALHWFNPLAALGWRALRRDQEAACDARVMACQPRERRAAYAAVIAGFATQSKCAPRLALAAPMACPVLGDRSIVQRLRSLAMSDISSRRRWSGRLLIGTAALALPLTGSISYAQDEVPPAPPAAPVAPVAPVAPAAPAAPSAAPAPPVHVVTRDGTTRVIRVERRVENDGRDEASEVGQPVVRRIVLRNGREMSAEDRAEFDRDMEQHRRDMAEMKRELSQGQAEMQRELARSQAEIHREFAQSQREIQREIRLAMVEAHKARPRVRVQCRDGQREVTETVATKDGETIFVCQALAMADARRALAAARAGIARSRDLSATQRAEALRALDEADAEVRTD